MKKPSPGKGKGPGQVAFSTGGKSKTPANRGPMAGIATGGKMSGGGRKKGRKNRRHRG